MSEEQITTHSQPRYPGNWRIAADYDPNQHLMNLKGRDYLNVQNRLLWFIRDQRDFIVRGLATTSYVVRTELVEQDRGRVCALQDLCARCAGQRGDNVRIGVC